MAEIRGLPPGRSGRLWVRQRLSTATRAGTLLDRKLRVLRAEQARLRDREAQAHAEWTRAYAEARRWMLRSAMVGGERAIRLATPSPTASIELDWRAVMGVRYPVVNRVAGPDPQPPRPAGTAAVYPAVSAGTAAVAAAARHAASAAALAAVDAEVTATAHRLRAINDRWIPRLEQARSAVDRRLEETERDETTRLRWADAHRNGPQRKVATP